MADEGCALVIERNPKAWFHEEHCYVIGKQLRDAGWMGVDWRMGAVRVWSRDAFGKVLESADFPELHAEVIWSHKWPFYGADMALPSFSCVHHAKMMLGVGGWWIQTPQGLADYLVERFGFTRHKPAIMPGGVV